MSKKKRISKRDAARKRFRVKAVFSVLAIVTAMTLLAYGIDYAIGVSHDDGAVALLYAQGDIVDVQITGYSTGKCDGGHFKSSFRATRMVLDRGMKNVPVSGFVCSSLLEASTITFR